MSSTRKRKGQDVAANASLSGGEMSGADDDDGWDDEEYADGMESGGASESDGEEAGARAAGCLDEEGRAAAQQEAVGEVSSLLGVSLGSASLLLRSARWSKDDLLSRYMENPEKVSLAAGVPPPSLGAGAAHASVLAPERTVCAICREEASSSTSLRLSSLACGHTYCDTCWGAWIESKVADGDTSVRCPGQACTLRVPEETVRALCSEATAERFAFLLRQSFVDEKRGSTWCPAAGCSLAVDTSGGGLFFSCAAGHSFCAGCKLPEAHAPAPCDVVKKWQKKCDDDSETFNWLSLNTQDCPQCKSTIEKNGGCNHMTCKSCKGEFCWVCLQKWSTHAGDFYNCNKYDAAAQKGKEESKASTRAALDRYLFHFHRFANHEASRKLEAATRLKAEEKMRSIQEAAPAGSAGWADVAFVQSATQEAIACRGVLKWTYVLAYFLPDGAPEKELFCFLQQDLESRTERLSGLLERSAEELLQPAVRAEVLALQGVAADSRRKLLRGAPATGFEPPAEAGAAAGPAEPGAAAS